MTYQSNSAKEDKKVSFSCAVDWKKFKKVNKDCFLPEEHIAFGTYANTPVWLRRYCVEVEKQTIKRIG